MEFMRVNNEQIIQRALDDERDFWRLHVMLRTTYPITPLGFNWNIRRWEGSRFYDSDITWPSARIIGKTQLWQLKSGDVVGAVIQDGPGNAYIQVHPSFRALERKMIHWAETHLAEKGVDGQFCLSIFVYDYDLVRGELLLDLGFHKTDVLGISRRLQLLDYATSTPIIDHTYTLRTTDPTKLDECQRLADLLNAAFGRNFHNALEYQNFTQYAPTFRRDLDLVAVAHDGTFVAYVGVPYDSENRLGLFEPVCTHPEHRQRGLAQGLMREGLRRLKIIGAREVIVETGNMLPANQLYDSLGFTEVCRGFQWKKRVSV